MEEWETGNAESDTGGEEGGCGDDGEVRMLISILLLGLSSS